MKILFPTDLSDDSLANIKRIIPFVVNKEKESEIEIFHVVEQPVQGATLMVDITKILIGDAENQMKKEKESIKEQFGIDVEMKATIGYYDVELKDRVKEVEPDLVILVSKARHGIMRYVSGQKSLKFIGELEAPLLVIPEDASLDNLDKFGFAVDKGESPTAESMSIIRSISEYYGAEVEMVHISNKEEENEEFYQRVAESSEFGDIEMIKKKSIQEGIQMWCLQHSIDVLVTVTHGKSAFNRTFSGSVTKDLIKDNLIALLIITQ